MEHKVYCNLIARVMSKHVCHILFIIVMSQAPRLHSMVHVKCIWRPLVISALHLKSSLIPVLLWFPHHPLFASSTFDKNRYVRVPKSTLHLKWMGWFRVHYFVNKCNVLEISFISHVLEGIEEMEQSLAVET